MTRPIVFLSDFGFRNEWVGICHAVLARAAPESRVIDLSHGVPPLDVVHDRRRPGGAGRSDRPGRTTHQSVSAGAATEHPAGAA